MEAEDVSFLENLPYTITIPTHNALIVHAGLVQGLPLPEQNRCLQHLQVVILQSDAILVPINLGPLRQG